MENSISTKKMGIPSIVFFFSVVVGTFGAPWDYDAKGASTWAANYPKCAGSNQSPINIATESVKTNASLGLFYRQLFYTPPRSMTLKNKGYTLQMDINDGGYTIDNTSLLPFPAKIAQYHFHWADSAATLGSEHTVDGTPYYGELHLVHYNTKYGNLSTAISKPDGLAVLGFFIEANYPQDNEYFNSFLDLISNVDNSGENYQMTSLFSLETLLPHDLSFYYRYKGSLTTPTCDESVIWVVFRDTIKISATQATKLSTNLYDSVDKSGKKVSNNFRPIQPLNGRVVSSPIPLTQDSSASVLSPSLGILLTLVFALLGVQM